MRGVTASSSILEYARENNPDLIILGTHGRRGFKRWLMGSVAGEIVRLAPCPVLSIKESAQPSSLGEIRRLLAPLDFSLASRTALKQAMEIGRVFGSSLHLLHVIQPPRYEDLYGVSMMPPERYYQQVETKAMGVMKKMVAELECELSVEYHLAKGHPAHEIVKFAEEHSVDMMIMAHLGISRVPDRLFGSVTEYVVRAAHRPVLTADLDQE